MEDQRFLAALEELDERGREIEGRMLTIREQLQGARVEVRQLDDLIANVKDMVGNG